MINELIELKKAIQGQKIILILEGRDSAGKSSTAQILKSIFSPKDCALVALPTPTPSFMRQWLSSWGKVIDRKKEPFIILDRSWYSRALCQRVNEWCTEKQAKNFLKNVKKFEKKLGSEFMVIKVYLSITKEEQEKRLNARKNSPLYNWKYSPNDAKALENFDLLTELRKEIISDSDWIVIDYNDKNAGLLELLETLTEEIHSRRM